MRTTTASLLLLRLIVADTAVGRTELLMTILTHVVVVRCATSVAAHATVEAATFSALVLLAGTSSSTTVAALHAAATTPALLTVTLSSAIVVLVVLASCGILVAVLVLHVLASECRLLSTDRVTWLAQLRFTVCEVAPLSEQAVSVLLVVAASLRLVVHVHLLALRIVEVGAALVVVATVLVILTVHAVVLLLLSAHGHLVIGLLGHHHLVREVAHLLVVVVALTKLVRRLHLHLLRHHHVRELRRRNAILRLGHILHQHVHEYFVGRLLLRGHV